MLQNARDKLERARAAGERAAADLQVLQDEPTPVAQQVTVPDDGTTVDEEPDGEIVAAPATSYPGTEGGTTAETWESNWYDQAKEPGTGYASELGYDAEPAPGEEQPEPEHTAPEEQGPGELGPEDEEPDEAGPEEEPAGEESAEPGAPPPLDAVRSDTELTALDGLLEVVDEQSGTLEKRVKQIQDSPQLRRFVVAALRAARAARDTRSNVKEQ
jgi:hypothetical protein